MNRQRLPFVFLAVGIVMKAVLVVLTELGDFPAAVNIATRYDPGALTFANWGSAQFFDPRRIAPGNGEVQIFEALLVIGFGVECLFAGYVVRWILNVARPAATAEGGKTGRESGPA